MRTLLTAVLLTTAIAAPVKAAGYSDFLYSARNSSAEECRDYAISQGYDEAFASSRGVGPFRVWSCYGIVLWTLG